jgi:hypothetical protein
VKQKQMRKIYMSCVLLLHAFLPKTVMPSTISGKA